MKKIFEKIKPNWLFLINEKSVDVLKEEKSFELSFTILKRVGVFHSSIFFGRLNIYSGVSERVIWLSKNWVVTHSEKNSWMYLEKLVLVLDFQELPLEEDEK